MAKTEKSTSYMMDVVRRFRKHKLAMISLCVLIVEVLLVIFLPIVLNLDPYTTDYSTYFGAPPSAQHWLGTDDVGRDSFARFIAGGRVSLSVGIISAIISLVIGVPLGLIAGYYRGWIETLIMRLSDVFMSFPSMVLILVLVSVLGPSITTVTVVIGILGWPRFARTIYGNVLSGSRVRICRGGPCGRHARRRDYDQIYPAELVRAGAHRVHFPRCAGDYHRIRAELPGHGCSGAAGFLGQHPL